MAKSQPRSRTPDTYHRDWIPLFDRRDSVGERITMVKSVLENSRSSREFHPALAHLDRREIMRAALTAPLHPGAERYYREAGVM